VGAVAGSRCPWLAKVGAPDGSHTAAAAQVGSDDSTALAWCTSMHACLHALPHLPSAALSGSTRMLACMRAPAVQTPPQRACWTVVAPALARWCCSSYRCRAAVRRERSHREWSTAIAAAPAPSLLLLLRSCDTVLGLRLHGGYADAMVHRLRSLWRDRRSSCDRTPAAECAGYVAAMLQATSLLCCFSHRGQPTAAVRCCLVA
jgi:hypothetical protein